MNAVGGVDPGATKHTSVVLAFHDDYEYRWPFSPRIVGGSNLVYPVVT